VRCGVGGWKEDCGDGAGGISADGRREVLAVDFKVEAFAAAAVFKSLPHVRVSKRDLSSSQSPRARVPAMAGFLSRVEGLTPKSSSSEPTSPPARSPARSSMVSTELKPCSTTSVLYLSWPDWSCHLRVCSEPSR